MNDRTENTLLNIEQIANDGIENFSKEDKDAALREIRDLASKRVMEENGA